MIEPYLTRTELRALTGRQQRATVTAWLREQQWAFVPDADGWPKVARALHDQRLGLADGAPRAHHSGPDFSSLENAA